MPQIVSLIRIVLVVFVCLVLSSCVADDPDPGLEVDSELEVNQIFSGLDSPTHFFQLDEDKFLVSQLAGDENDNKGQILLIDISTGSKEIIYDQLDKPTGVVEINGQVFVMERNSFSVGDLSGVPLKVIEQDMPFNGRSQGTLTVTPQGRVLYNTSGRTEDAVVEVGSGILFEYDPVTEKSKSVASGFKHAYSHTYDSENNIWVTEIGDGTYDGADPNEELIKISDEGSHAGWPKCINNRVPVSEFGGVSEFCNQTLAPVAMFSSKSTPVSVVVSPWEGGEFIVALWNESKVVSVNAETSEVEDVYTGIEHPQSLISIDESLLVLDFDDGQILELS